MEDSAGTGDGAELALNKSRLDVRSKVLRRRAEWLQQMAGSIPMDLEELSEEAEMWCMIH